MSVYEEWDNFKVLVASIELDVKKCAKGNKSAGVRARKGLRLVKQSAALLVKQLFEVENAPVEE